MDFHAQELIFNIISLYLWMVMAKWFDRHVNERRLVGFLYKTNTEPVGSTFQDIHNNTRSSLICRICSGHRPNNVFISMPPANVKKKCACFPLQNQKLHKKWLDGNTASVGHVGSTVRCQSNRLSCHHGDVVEDHSATWVVSACVWLCSVHFLSAWSTSCVQAAGSLSWLAHPGLDPAQNYSNQPPYCMFQSLVPIILCVLPEATMSAEPCCVSRLSSDVCGDFIVANIEDEYYAFTLVGNSNTLSL